MPHVDGYLKLGQDYDCSDIHLAVNSRPTWRRFGQLLPIWEEAPNLTPQDTEVLARGFLEDPEWNRLQQRGDVDFAYANDFGRYRASVVKQRLGYDICFRIINTRVRTMEEIGLPTEYVVPLTRYTNGLILVTGSVGSGKSTTLASIVDFINQDRHDHIITLEDPIEYLIPSKNCHVNQREVHKHTESFARALRGALREDPDVIMVGEMRDLETISLALTAAETGHLVLGTLHTGSAARTVDRVLDVFPVEQRDQIRIMVSESLRGIISQQLVPRADGNGRALAIEMLVNTPAIANCIREGKTFMIPGCIQTGKAQGIRNEKQYCDAKDKEEIEGLADIIEADGMVLQDLLVKKLDADEYKIIAGHKRHAACKLLVEERGKKEFEFLPCFEQNISDIQAEFQIYSSNCHHEETPYEIMHKLERMQYLINNYPEEFPEIQGGRMVDRLAKKYNLSKSTVGEYLTISKNLGDTAMDEFQKGEIDKSAAVTLASMPEEDQNQALSQGRKTDKELKAYKKEVLEPTSNEILTAYDELDIREIDCPDRKETCKKLIERYGKSHLGQTSDTINISCTPKTITINGKEITWNRFVKLIEKVIPAYQVEVQAKKEKKKLYFEKRELQVSYETYDRLLSGQQRCILVKDDTYQEAELVDIYAIASDGSETESIEFTITYINKQDSGIEKGYSILNLEMIPIFC